MNSANSSIVWIVAAGTGGHIFPGLELAKELRKQNSSVECLFFGTQDRLEATLVPKHNEQIFFLRSGAWKGRDWKQRLLALLEVAIGFFQCLWLTLRRPPKVVISVGGYVSLPVVLASRWVGAPLVMLEPNIRSGVANRMLSRMAKMAFCSPASDALRVLHCPTEDVGVPVRRDIRAIEVRAKLQNIVVMGGSQGAWSLVDAVLRMLCDHLELRQFQWTIQTGSANATRAQSLSQELGLNTNPNIRLLAFADDVPGLLHATDLVIARAGAMTVVELSTAAMPTVFVPFPYAADNHQHENAKILADAGACLLVSETKANWKEDLWSAVHSLAVADDHFSKRQQMSDELKKWARPMAGERIAKRVLELME